MFMAGWYCNVWCYVRIRIFCWLPHPPWCCIHSDHFAITLTLNFDKLWPTPFIERQKSKHIIRKFEDVGLKRRFDHRLNSVSDSAPGELLRVNWSTDSNRFTDLLTFMSTAILKYFGCGNLQYSMCLGGMSEERSWMLDTGRQWATGCKKWSLGELKCRAPAAFTHEIKFWERMRINFVLS